MEMKKRNLVFISWVAFQRRSETIASLLNANLKYFHYKWEEKNKILKVISYLLKSIDNFIFLMKHRPEVIIIQLAPTPPLYVGYLYSLFFKTEIITDCHNTMIYDSHWIKWPLAGFLLRKSSLVILHNPEVHKLAKNMRINSMICSDPIPNLKTKDNLKTIGDFDYKNTEYILLPSNMCADDEPTEIFFRTARKHPQIKFVLTGFIEKVPNRLRRITPENVHYTGFLNEIEFNTIYSHATAAIVLSERIGTQPSGASEAISLCVPLIVSDMETTRKLYGENVVYTKNTETDLSKSIEYLLDNKELYKERVKHLKNNLNDKVGKQLEFLKKYINILIKIKYSLIRPNLSKINY